MTSEIINGEMLSESEARELLSQVQGFIKKPYRPQDLVEQISEVLATAEE